MNIELKNAINYLQELKQKIENKTASAGFIYADLQDKFSAGLLMPFLQLASDPKPQFTNVAELWNKIEAEAKASSQQPTASSKKLRLCKIEPNTDSFYFHEFRNNADVFEVTQAIPAPQHKNCFLTNSIGLVAVVEDKKGKVFFADAEHLKFID